ncbi:MAG TPA: NAD(P)-dependent alcohol dehydrogenase [Candidatus Glassbacteria bacterium]|nr:NAD(P)-dependent alcohol dehydrogenase [Candidatus Glassbacteria bacterium]
MKAMLIRAYGGPEVFEYGEIETPRIDENEILVKANGSSVNPVDCMIRRGLLKNFIRLKLPAALGVDVCGEVAEVGKNVRRFKPGDVVYAFLGLARSGGYGEYVKIPEAYAALAPANIGRSEAGVVPGVGLTALEAFKDHAPLAAGQKVLINGASGGVGTFAVQIAKSQGAEVTAVCSSAKIDLVKQLGADHAIDYTTEDLYSPAARYDVILNCVRGTSNKKLRNLLVSGGKLLIITGTPLQIPLFKLMNLFSSKKSILFFVKPIGGNLQILTKLIEEGKVRPVIEKTYSWKELAQAHRHCETGRVRGKIAIAID